MVRALEAKTGLVTGAIDGLGKEVASALAGRGATVLCHREVRWKEVKGHQKTGRAPKAGNDRADRLAVATTGEAIADLSGASSERLLGG